MAQTPPRSAETLHAERSAARLGARLALAYLAVGVAWILVSSSYAARLGGDPATLARIELVKGLAFIAATALLLFALARHWILRFALSQQDATDRGLWMRLATEGSGGADWRIELSPERPEIAATRAWFSPRFKEFLGYADHELDDVLGPLLQRVIAEDQARLMTLVEECLHGRREAFDASFRILHRDGSVRWVRSRGALERDAQQHPRCWIGISWDVTADQQTRERLQLAATVFDSGSEGVLVMDDQERIMAVNAAYSRITGYTLEDVRGRKPSEFLASARNVDLAPTIRRMVLQQGAWRGEYRGHRRDGAAYSAQLIVSAVHDGQGRVTHFVGILSDLTELRQSREQLDHMRKRDGLTGLANEALFGEHLAATLAAGGERAGAMLGLIDVSRFQNINDSLGRRGGDLVLVELAKRLAQLPGVSMVARIGGDSFALLVEHNASIESAGSWGEQLLAELGRGYSVLGQSLHLAACVGIGLFPQHADGAEELMRRASSALSEARRKGPGTVLCYRAEMSERSLLRVRMEADLRNALRRGELACCFQPRVDLATGRWVGAEALVRWPRADGLVPTERFLAVAEDAGLLPDIDRWMLRAAVMQTADWLRSGVVDADFRVSVNVSATQVEAGLVERVQRVLEHSALPPSMLELELTEKLIMSAPERASACLRQLRELGVRVAVDDFGTGYSSLSYLHRLPIDSLKVDRSFVADLPDRADALAIVRSIVALGRSLKLRLVAEGVETQRQREVMRELGCDEAQGFLFAPGLAARDFRIELLRTQVPVRTAFVA